MTYFIRKSSENLPLVNNEDKPDDSVYLKTSRNQRKRRFHTRTVTKSPRALGEKHLSASNLPKPSKNFEFEVVFTNLGLENNNSKFSSHTFNLFSLAQMLNRTPKEHF